MHKSIRLKYEPSSELIHISGIKTGMDELLAEVLPRQSLRGGREKSIFPSREWFSKVETGS